MLRLNDRHKQEAFIKYLDNIKMDLKKMVRVQ
jgi:hypothetical protein